MGLNAKQEYVPVWFALALLSRSIDNFEATSFIMKLGDDCSGIPSLYHCKVIGSSPLVTAHETWISCPSSTSSGKAKGRIWGSTGENKTLHQMFAQREKLSMTKGGTPCVSWVILSGSGEKMQPESILVIINFYLFYWEINFNNNLGAWEISSVWF